MIEGRICYFTLFVGTLVPYQVSFWQPFLRIADTCPQTCRKSTVNLKLQSIHVCMVPGLSEYWRSKYCVIVHTACSFTRYIVHRYSGFSFNY